MDSAFSLRDVAKIFGLKEARLRYWAQTGFINPSGRAAGRSVYTFTDLIEIKAAKELLEQQIPLQRVRRNLQALRQALPGHDALLRRLRVRSNGDKLIVIDGDAVLEPISGQLLLDFDVSALDQHVADVLRLPMSSKGAERPAPAASATEASTRAAPTDRAAAGEPLAQPPAAIDPQSAYAWFQEGLRLEALESCEREAIEAYEQALQLDPGLAAAQTNLGNLYYRRGERSAALRCYGAACAMDPDQPEAHYNLGNIYEEEGDLDLAIAEYRRAVKLQPDFADGHFNLALVLERVGGRQQAIQHWQRFLELTDGAGPALAAWRDSARQHLERLRDAIRR